jgi:UDP-3-O-[3-hydroxymyristoyl] N-acetylglucosamine deacetylase
MTASAAASRQRTLQLKVSVTGVGLHSGRSVKMTLQPAPVDAGIVFARTDLPHAIEIPARAEFVVDTTLNTTLGKDGVRIGTVEHLLSALYGMGVDNVRIELDGPEVPILDGSALPFVQLVESAGIREQRAPRRVAVVRKPVTITDGDKEVRLTPASAFSIACAIDFRHPLITDQKLAVEVNARNFVREIARARTFGFAKEVEYLRSRGLALGGSLENAIVVDDFHILNPEGLRFPDEFVRHKILDAIGDLSLLGAPIIGQLHARKTGHALNHKLVKKLLTEPGLVEMVTLGDAGHSRAASAAVELPVAAMEGSLA